MKEYEYLIKDIIEHSGLHEDIIKMQLKKLLDLQAKIIFKDINKCINDNIQDKEFLHPHQILSLEKKWT